MTIREIVTTLSDMAFEEDTPFSKLQEIRQKHLNKRPYTYHMFSTKSIKDDYAYHSGGRKEFQFNIGEDWFQDEPVLRYGLAFSLNEDRTLNDFDEEFRSKIERFNDFLQTNPARFDDMSMWYYEKGDFAQYYKEVQPIDDEMFQAENFIFVGKYLSKEITEINFKDIENILKTFDSIMDIYEKVEFGDQEIEKRIARLTWNTNGWIKPSGETGKSKNNKTHEGRYGYGHEEWLLDTSKLIDGFHYGFLEPIRQQQQAFERKKYNIWLYTIDSTTKKRYWIGEIDNVEIINGTEAENIKEIYLKNKWYSEMHSQIIECQANDEGFSEWNGIDLFNVRFKPKDVRFNSDYIELSKDNHIYAQSRYNFTKFTEGFSPNSLLKGFEFIIDTVSDDTKEEKIDGVGKTTYYREPKAIEITFVHKAISDGLKCELIRKFGEKNVSAENGAGYGNNSIDMVVKCEDHYIFYEIKAYNSSRSCIREALGQLLEYSCWINNATAAKLVVVSQKLGDTDDSIKYVQHLRSLYSLPIYFQTYDLVTKELSPEF
ncbi:hypothetical protein [Chryseobacterium luquanense]|uniref:Restriction endonuclease type IV Mrr domain-containing protein n=1 Tax=Chryseobacterium luquanense TaxID=2983766 RepID=A0ABT3XY93_9FLAO|nr:hypothetical protein [Chryseobacterium luquanense]MCX8530863.1 hypothetical protein [Chryseobacterium luquanense]